MVRFHPIAASLLAVVAFSPSTEAFSPTIGSRSHTSNLILAVGVADEDDFDAPSLANPVMSGKVGKLDHDPIVDDECYLGKDNQFDDCVDFDPMHNVEASKSNEAAFELPDFSKIAEEMKSAIKESPLARLLNK